MAKAWRKDRCGMSGYKGKTNDDQFKTNDYVNSNVINNSKNQTESIKIQKTQNINSKNQSINKPRYAKGAGVKNNFQFGDNVYVSTFGKKNETIIDKVKDNGEVTEINSGYTYDISLNDKKLILNSKILPESHKNLAINNNKVNKKFDSIGLNEAILKEIFQKGEYSDTIHIQVGYNILDMNKIISLYYYNIVYTINHLSRDTYHEMEEDFLGNFNFSSSIEKYDSNRNWNFYDFNSKAKDRYLYFYPFNKLRCDKLTDLNNELKELKKEKSEKEKSQNNDEIDTKIANKKEEINTLINDEELSQQQDKYNYDVLRILCFVRNSIVHSSIRGSNSEGKYNIKNALYKINNINILPEDLTQVIDELFEGSLIEINDSFSENAKRNLWIISQLQNKNIDNKLINNYYEYSILKKGKNIGINIKKVRENIINNDFGTEMNDEEFIENRKKINTVYDFMIYLWLNTAKYYAQYNSFKKPIDEYIQLLRKQTISKKLEAKDEVYEKIANDFRMTNFDIKTKIVSVIKKSFDENTNISISEEGLKKVSPSDFSLFSKLIYFISYFLSNKEKNELITSLTNKLDNIDSLNKMYSKAAELNNLNTQELDYNEDYKLFNNAEQIASELRIINSLSHMQDFKVINMDDNIESVYGLYKGLYIDALNSLGAYNSESIYLSFMNSNDSKKKKLLKIKNFIKINIINSIRFQYIIKYIDPIECQKYIECECLVKSILNQMEDSILIKYYNNLFADIIIEIKDKQNVVNEIYIKLLSFNYIYLSNGNLDDNTEIEKIKSLGKLYYTIIYLAVKNLVNVNSIFAIACECYERDYSMVCGNKDDVYGSLPKVLKLFNLSVAGYEGKKNNKKAIKKLKSRFFDKDNNCIFNNKDIIKIIRNNCLHLTIINNASKYLNDIKLEPQLSRNDNVLPIYYDLYVFILEKTILKEVPIKLIKVENGEAKEKDYNKLVKNHPDKDLIKYLLIPFAYNLARYKNLTIRDLFYDQYKYLKESKN